ncbi:MAG: tetratricopeptide repeat protein [Chloroflexota bacterium]
MRRLLLVTCCLAFFGLALPAFAQTPETTPLPSELQSPVVPALEAMEAAAARAEAAAVSARQSMDDAQRYANDSSRFFSLFEAFGVVVAVAAAALGVLGITRQVFERNALRDMRERFETDMTTQQQNLQKLRDEVLGNAEAQRHQNENALLALSLLPYGERQYKAQDLKGAADTYLRAIALDAGNPLIQYRLGYVYVHSDQFEQAETHLKRALEIDREYVLAMAALGYVYRRMGDRLPEGLERDQMYNQGERHLLEALKRSPKVVDDDGESWWGSLGGLYRRRGQVNQAVYAYDQAAKVTPHSSYPFSNLALLYMAKNDRDRMLNMYKKVERLAHAEALAEVDNYWAYADIFTSRLALGKHAEAEEAFASFLAIAPSDSPYARESLAETLTRLMDALGGAQAAPHIPSFIARLR